MCSFQERRKLHPSWRATAGQIRCKFVTGDCAIWKLQQAKRFADVMMYARMPRRALGELVKRLLHAVEVELFGIGPGRHNIAANVVWLLADGLAKQVERVGFATLLPERSSGRQSLRGNVYHLSRPRG